MIATGMCVHCEEEFEFEHKGRKRVVCDECYELFQQRYKRRLRHIKKVKPFEERGELENYARMSRRDVGIMLGITADAVRQKERALLYKLRKSPAAQEFFKLYLAEGAPILGAHCGQGREGLREESEKLGERLVDYTIAISEWFALYETLVGRGCEEEAREVMEEVVKFQKAIQQIMRETK